MHLNRVSASLTHLGISAMVVGIFLLLTFFVWYPSPLFTVEGTKLPLQILVGVDIVLGPLLTLVVFKPGKKGLKFDLGMIAAVQLAAFIYGSTLIYTERPAFIAFAVDRFSIIPRSEVVESQLDKIDHNKIQLSTFGPTWVYAEFPEDTDERQQLLNEVLSGKPDIDRRPQYYRNLEENISRNFSKSMDLVEYMNKEKSAKPVIDTFLKKHNTSLDQIAAFPLSGKHHDMVIALDKKSKSIIDVIDINPWITVTAK